MAGREQPYVTPLVRDLAQKHGVNLASVEGSGAGGRIRKDDVLAAAGVLPVKPAPGAGAAAGAAAPRRTTGAWAASPLVDRVRASGSAPAGSGPAPTLFPVTMSGQDLPPFTASGIDPTMLLNVPAAARHPMAQVPTVAEAAAIMNTYGGEGGAAAAANDFRYHDGNLDYESRVVAWSGESRTSSSHNPWLTDDALSEHAAAARRPAHAAAAAMERLGREDNNGWFAGYPVEHPLHG